MEFRVGGVGVLQFRFLLELIYRHIEFIGSRVSGKDHGAQGQWRAVLWDHPNDKNRDHDLNKQTRSSTSRSGGIAASMGVYRGQGYRFGIISAIQGPNSSAILLKTAVVGYFLAAQEAQVAPESIPAFKETSLNSEDLVFLCSLSSRP